MSENKREVTNHARVIFEAKSMNESFARMTIMAFMTEMNPTLDELQDVKTAVSEAVTNAIIHGYGMDYIENEKDDDQENVKQVEMICHRQGQILTISIIDYGVGIPNVEEARQPFFTTKPELERSGMGFSFMETFMDKVKVESIVGEGTRVTMTKMIGENSMEDCEQ